MHSYAHYTPPSPARSTADVVILVVQCNGELCAK